MSKKVASPGVVDELQETPAGMKESELERCTCQVFSNPLLLKEIFKLLKFQDLLNSSLVDKKWHVMAREVLRERGTCLAAVEDGYDGSDIAVFNSLAADMTQSPFSGVSIHLVKRRHREGFLAWPQSDGCRIDLARKILERIDIQHIKIGHFRQRSGRLRHITLDAILRQVAPTLKGFSLEVSPDTDVDNYSFTKFFGISLTGGWLPSLNTLEIVINHSYEDARWVLQQLLRAARNLQDLEIISRFDEENDNEEAMGMILCLPHKPFHLIKDYQFRCELGRLDFARRLAKFGPQLRKLRFSVDSPEFPMKIQYEDMPPEDQAKVRKALEAVLLSSNDSLQKLAVEHHDEFVLMMSQWNIPVLSKLEYLELTYNQRIDSDGSFTWEKIDFATHFPRLTTVSISEAHRRLEDVQQQEHIYVSEQLRRQTLVYSCPSVTTLYCYFFETQADLLLSRLGMCGRLFPNVKHLHVSVGHWEWLSKDFWTFWPGLETVRFFAVEPKQSNFDSVFLGLHHEEVKRIVTEIDPRDQELLHIVPTSPSMMNLKHLKYFLITTAPITNSCCNNSSGSAQLNDKNLQVCRDGYSKRNFLWSPLTGFCAFSRMPGLKVEVDRFVCSKGKECCLELTHLEPFVKFADSTDTEIRDDTFW